MATMVCSDPVPPLRDSSLVAAAVPSGGLKGTGSQGEGMVALGWGNFQNPSFPATLVSSA